MSQGTVPTREGTGLLTDYPQSRDEFDDLAVASADDTWQLRLNQMAQAINALQAVCGITSEGCAVKPFFVRQTLTSAAAATPVNVLPSSAVPDGKAAYLTGGIIAVSGATAWTDVTGTLVKVQSTAGTPLVLASAAKALLTGNSATFLTTQANLTLAVELVRGEGAGNSQGLDFVADANFAAGSDIIVSLWGVIKSA